MTTAEIQALVETMKRWPDWLRGEFSDKCMSAITTLLARDNIKTFADQEVRIAELERRLAAIVKLSHPPRYGDLVEMGGKLEVATERLDKIRAIAEGRENG